MNIKDIEITTVPPDHLGGQQCGRIPSGVSVKHLPTGLRSFCEAERSQQKNLKVALAMIEYGLAELGYVEEEEKVNLNPLRNVCVVCGCSVCAPSKMCGTCAMNQIPS